MKKIYIYHFQGDKRVYNRYIAFDSLKDAETMSRIFAQPATIIAHPIEELAVYESVEEFKKLNKIEFVEK